MAKGTTTIKETYATAQTDTILDSPATPKSFIVWSAIIKSPDGETTIKFADSGDVIAQAEGEAGIMGIGMEGDTDEDILVTCPANTTVIVQFDEL